MNWSDLFIYDTSWAFAAEILIRCVIMFMMIVLFLRLTGKRGIRQLSVFEITIILALGSISGDPMFTKDIPLIQAVLVMSVIIFMYRLTTWLMMKHQWFEDILEGKSLYIVEDGMMVLEDIAKGKYSHDEFFAEMRQQNTEHLGQIRTALLETDGEFSILFYEPDQVKYGLPLFPKTCQVAKQVIPNTYYACIYCGYVDKITDPKQHCTRCQCSHWTKALKTIRTN
jgi:uncharacterized membrane protein YcaP (DUF421 family)